MRKRSITVTAYHMEKEKDWEVLFQEAIKALEKANVAIDDIASWSGSSGNWPLHDSLEKVEKALKILKS